MVNQNPEIVAEYVKLFGVRPDGRVSNETILKENEAKRLRIEALAKSRAEAEKEAELKKLERETRKAERGTIREFVSKVYKGELSDSEQKMCEVMRKVEIILNQAEDSISKFVKNFQENPAYTLESSYNMFEWTAQYDVAKIIESLYNNGCSFEELEKFANEKIIASARWPSMSTSQTKNLMHQYLLAAWANFMDKY